MDLVAKVGLETHDKLAFELELRTRQSLGEDVIRVVSVSVDCALRKLWNDI
jgi:hypothetical protein